MPVPTMLDVDDGRHLLLTERDLGLLQLSTVLYYLHESNPDNGLVRDKTDPKAPVSIAAVGMALATIPGVVERGVLFRDFAAKITLKRLRYLRECPQGPNRMRPATKASSVISWTSRPAAAPGSASSPPSTRRSCSRARRGEGVRDPLWDPFDAEMGAKCPTTHASSIASPEGNWRVLHSGLVFPPPSQAGRRGFESHRPLSVGGCRTMHCERCPPNEAVAARLVF
jgi:hypothetical protein